MTCYHTAATVSQVFCCKINKPDDDCAAGLEGPPKCMPGTRECSDATGGGCCPSDTHCSPNGCIQIKKPSIIGSSPTAVGSTVVTITENPASTATLPKEGEVGQVAGVGRAFEFSTCCVPWLVLFLIASVACLMNLL
ncbi:hypothetical protein B0O99DRAFT_613531 [Bisporella sp. PMI_857]|nr:hypothetical protein B0O99DRAFT_613531 [Bisporella sp. PMI_857]